MNEKIQKKLLKIEKAIGKYQKFFEKNIWKNELKKNSLKDSDIGVLINNFDIESFMNKFTDDMKENEFTDLLIKEYQPKNKFNIGDKVDFINDYGVVFSEQTITNFTLYEFGGYLYDTDKNCTSWCWYKEKNLKPINTYKIKNFDMELNNGLIAKFLHFSYWDNRMYIIENNQRIFNAVLVDSVLYSVTDDDEPIEPLNNEYQAKNKDLL